MIKFYEENLDKKLNILNEAGFLSADLFKGISLLTKQIQKRTGIKCYFLKKLSWFKDTTGIYNCVTIITARKQEIRINLKRGTNNTNSIVSIDYFVKPSSVYPDFRVEIDKQYNILHIIGVLCDLLVNPFETIKQVQESLKYSKNNIIAETIQNKNNIFEDWIKDSGLNLNTVCETKKIELFKLYSEYAVLYSKPELSFPTFNNIMKDYLESKGLKHQYDRVRVMKGNKFTILPNEQDVELINYIKENEDINDLSQNIEELKLSINVVSKAKGRNGKISLICYGKPGLAKTTTVRDTLNNLSINYAYGRINDIKNTGDFYKLLYRNNGRVLVLDDSDVLVKKGSPIANMILAATDSVFNNRRLIYVNTKDPDILRADEKDDKEKIAKKIPQQFMFTGALIFISNLNPPKINPALISRSILVEMDASDESIIDMIRQGLDKFYPEYSSDVKQKALDFIIALRGENVLKNLDFRIYSEVLQFFDSDMPIELVKAILSKKLLKIR